MSASTSPRTLAHLVAKGETLAAIAASYNIPIAKLRQANPGLAAAKDADEIDRVRHRSVAVPRPDPGTRPQGMLRHDAGHELEAPHRLAVLYASAASDLTGLFDVVAPDGKISRDMIYGRFEVHYVAPANVSQVVWAAGLVPADDPPHLDFPKRGGYCDPELAPLKKREGGGSGDPAPLDKLEAALKKEGRFFLASGSLPVQPGPNVRMIRLVIAEAAPPPEETATFVNVGLAWKSIPIAKLAAEKRYRLALLASNGATAVDGAVSGDIHMIRVSLDVELPEVAARVPHERALEVRVHDPAMASTALAHREEDEALQYCTDSLPLKRDGSYKEDVGKAILGERAFEKQEPYDHAARKVHNDTADHLVFKLPEKGGEVDVPPFALLKALAHGKKALDQTTESDRPEKQVALKFQAGFYPYLAEYLRVRLFHREVEPMPGAEPPAIEAAEKDVDRADEEVKKAEGEVRALREEAIASASEARAGERRVRRSHTRRLAAERALEELRVRRAGGGVPPGERRALDLAIAHAEERLHDLWAQSRKDLEDAAAKARSPAAAAEGEERRRRAAREARAAEALRAAQARRAEAQRALDGLAAVKLLEVVPVYAPPGSYEALEREIQPTTTTVLAVISDGFDKLHSARVDGERVQERGQPRRRIAESFDGSYLVPAPSADAAAQDLKPAPVSVRVRWSADRARSGEEVWLEAELGGIPPGTSVSFEVFPEAGGAAVAKLEAKSTVAGARARWKWTAPAGYEGTGKEPGFVFAARVPVEGGEPVTVRSLPGRWFDVLEVEEADADGIPLAHRRVVVTLAGGAAVEARLDGAGTARLEVPPGRRSVRVLEPDPPAPPPPPPATPATPEPSAGS